MEAREAERFVEAIEAAAYADLFAAAPGALRLSVHQIGGATALVAPAIPDAFFNRVIGLGVHRAASEADLDALASTYREAGVKKWWIHLAPSAQPEELARWLEARGFTPAARRGWAKMTRGTEPAPQVATTLEVRNARSDEAEQVARTIAAGYGMPAALASWFAAVSLRPRWRSCLALDAGRPVGAGLLYVDGRDAWLGAGAVLQEARGRHAHRALMALRIREAIAAGCTRIATETGEPVGDEPNPSLANMQACGFRKVSSRLNFAAPSA